MSKQDLQPLRGFRDFYPEDWAFQNWLYGKVKEVAENFGYQEYEGPTLESLDLYAAKSGEELVKKQAFTLTDQSGKIVALRPEMTPTLARMVAQKEQALVFPVRWFTFGRRFRYEKPQKGRGREFFQWDIDILGSESPEADAEIISIAAQFYKYLGLNPKEVKIKISDREFIQKKLQETGVAKNKMTNLFKIIDKKNKVSQEKFKAMLKEELAQRQADDLLKLLSSPNSYKESSWLSKIFEIVQKMGLSEYIEFDASIVRGLDYYTRTVFEGWDIKGEFRSIWGGGRYDNLTQDVGGKTKISGVGFAMGDMVIAEVLKANNIYPKLAATKIKVLITVFSPELLDKSIDLALRLRLKSVNCELYPDSNAKLDKQLKYADKKGIPYAVIIGPDEASRNRFVFKNLKSKIQEEISEEEIIKKVRI